jgi:hypothetical protein
MADEQEGTGDGAPETSAPEKMFSQTQLEGLINDRMKRAEKSIAAKLEAQLMVDDTFRERALQTWDVKPPKVGGDLDDAKVRDLFSVWETKHVNPLKADLDASRDAIKVLQSGQLEAAILATAAPWAQEGVLKMQIKGHSALFNMIGSEFERDPESGEWRVLGPKGDYRPSPDGKSLYMDVPERMKEWREDPVNAPFIRDTTQGGADFDSESRSGGKKVYTAAEYKQLCDNADYYAKHRDELNAAVREKRVR